MIDWNFVTHRLATGGGIATAADAAALKAAGISHILDVRELDDQPILKGQFQYLHNPTADDGQPKPASWFAASLVFILPALDRPGDRVYCHCQQGRNRGPSTVFAAMIAWGLTAADAEAMIRKARPSVTLAYKADAVSAIALLGY